MSEPIRDTETAVRELGALPVPVGPQMPKFPPPPATEVEKLHAERARLQGLLAEAVADVHRARRERDLIRERVSEPFGCQHCGTAKRSHGRRYLGGVGMHAWERPTDEQVKDRMLARRAARMPLEAAQKPSETYPPALPWAALMDGEDLADFLDELAASAITHASSETALAEVEATCGRWRAIAEAQHAHNTAPGPDSEADGITRRIAPVQALREDEPADEPTLTVLRASWDSLILGHYTTEKAAREHCEKRALRDLPSVSLDWIEDEEDRVAELVGSVGEEERPLGYTVMAVDVASEYDEEADE
ncbi:hypothetical protein [Streptomyces luteogriseus]|uniref:hypothetical protein n=1 Tax=Streptomyces luteogriseus TaxID=68233 RepID=UPI0037F2694B